MVIGCALFSHLKFHNYRHHSIIRCINAFPHVRFYVSTEGLCHLASFQRWSYQGARVTIQPEANQGPHLLSINAKIKV